MSFLHIHPVYDEKKGLNNLFILVKNYLIYGNFHAIFVFYFRLFGVDRTE
jgi:hypothetical protein